MTLPLWTFSLALVLQTSPARQQDDANFFEQRIRPLLIQKCYQCHAGTKAGGGLRLDSRSGWQHGGDSGPAIVPGQPERSLLIRAVRYESLEMPPPEEGARLTQQQVADLVRWVADGAFDPRDAAPATSAMTIADARDWWAFQPLPVADHRGTPKQIDRFVDARLQSRNLTTTPPADRRSLIRRATYDLTGLPPTPAEVAAFVEDPEDGAFERVVDRLLESDRYGERFGRHWLDIVRYADTAGENTDRPLPHAWRYRNWVIEALNRDIPFDDFVRLQLSGDLTRHDAPFQDRNEGIVATGYLAIARRFGHDIDHNLPLLYEDIIDNVGKAFLGLTIACARCHDHKYDPISQADYYALFGIFDSTKYSFPGCEPRGQPSDLVPLLPKADIDAQNAAWRKRLTAWEHSNAKGAQQGDKPVAPTHPLAYAAFEGKAQHARIHPGGDAERAGELVPRRWLEVFGGAQLERPTESGRRELAEWIVRRPLMSRVIVNRVWQWHFGRGLVTTPNDFGSRGGLPSHPRLLDWLAAEFQAGGYRLKSLHRLIMRTQAYQRAAAVPSEADPENRLLGHFSFRRLTGEEIRDSLLVAAGVLDLTPGEAHPFPPESTWKFTQHDPFSAVYESNRRSVYLMVQRQRRHPYLALFDGADPNASTGSRSTTTAPTQALYFLNDPFFHRQATAFAQVLLDQPSDRRLDYACRHLFQRPPGTHDEHVTAQLLSRYPGSESEKWAAVARVLLSSNEFVMVD